MALIHPVILSGGSGTRLWPLSRSQFPKQLLDLAGPMTMIQQTMLRSSGPQFQRPLLICNAEHRFLVAEQARNAGVVPQVILLEPAGRNTAPAAALAALLVAKSDPGGVLLLLPADHLVRDQAAFLGAVEQGVAAAAAGNLVTFGIQPANPDTGYGYIQRGHALIGSKSTFAVARFVEKPDAATAASYIESGDYYWNSGMFAFRADAYLAELERLEPQLLESCRAALAGAAPDFDFLRIAVQPFTDCKAISIDYAVMEHTSKAVVVPVEMGWSDIGSWDSLWQVSDRDSGGNAFSGDVLQLDSRNSYLRSEGPLVAALGVEDLVVVATPDAVLVSSRARAQDVKKIVSLLKQSGRELHISHRKVHRPWGSYESIDVGANYQVKRIAVRPGAKLSLQMHHKRAEHWVVVSGLAQVTCGEKVFILKENESTYIPLSTKHRLENVGTEPLHLIEVQSGAYLGEDDIVRFEDSYGRSQ